MNITINNKTRPELDDRGVSQLLAATAHTLCTRSAFQTSNVLAQEYARVGLVSLKATSRPRRAETDNDGQTANVTPLIYGTGNYALYAVPILETERKPFPLQEERGE